MEERKFVCKYCNKKYPCGKSLGGHIRTHMSNEHSSYQSKEVKTNADDRVVKFDEGRKRKRDFGVEEAASENPIYGLRENPKRTTKLVHPNAAMQKERFCKECGKGFLSLKALCGHMACHSEKDKAGTMNKFKNNSGFSVKQKMVMMDDSQSDTETSAPNYPRRSRRMRFKTVNTDKNDYHASSVPLTNGSSSVPEVEQEEEIAKCLMLLSKDSGQRGRFVLPTESSDNNSVAVEVKSPSVYTRITLKNGTKSCVSNGVEIVEEEEKKVVLYKNMKLKSAEIFDSDNSDSGYFRNGPKNLDLYVPIDNKPLISNREFKTPKVESRSGFEFDRNYDSEYSKMLIKNRGITRSIEPRKLILEDLDYDDTTDGLTKEEEFINWRKRPSYNSIGVPYKKTPPNGFRSEGTRKKQESLNSEKIISGSYDSTYDNESDESSTDTDAYPAPIYHSSSKVINGKKTSQSKTKLKSKKTREHRCPICYRIFKSGQALGGHKRSHFLGGSEENTIVIRQDSPVVPCLIDLNLPAPVDD